MALVLMAPVLAGIMWVQFGWPGRISGQTVPPTVFSADLTSFFVPGVTEVLAIPSLATRIAAFTSNVSEAGLYVGLPFLALLLWAWWHRLARPWLGGIIVALTVAAVLSLGPVLHIWGQPVGPPLPEALLNRVPLLRELVPARFGLYLGLGVALAVSLIMDRTASHPNLVRWAQLLTSVGVASWLPFALPVSATAVPSIFRTPAAISGAVVAFGPADSSAGTDTPMLWQATADFAFRTIGAYRVGRDFADSRPSELPPFERAMLELQQGRETWAQALSSRAGLEHELARDGVSLVIVGPMPHESEAVQFVTALLGHSGTWTGGVWMWHVSRPSQASVKGQGKLNSGGQQN